MKHCIKLFASAIALSCAAGAVQAEEVTLDDVIKAGMDYIVTEYALDQVQYTACGLTLAKKSSPANFDRAKREFLSVFNDEVKQKLDRDFYGAEMTGLKDRVSQQGIMVPIEKAKAQGKNMDAYCDREVTKLLNLNLQTKRNWFAIKAKLPQ